MFNTLWLQQSYDNSLRDEVYELQNLAIFFFWNNALNLKVISIMWLPFIIISFIIFILIEQKILTRVEKSLNSLKFIQNFDFKQFLINFFLVNVLLIINLPTLVTIHSKSPLVFFIGFCIQPTFWIPVSIFILFNSATFTNIGLTDKVKINQVFFNDMINLTSFFLRFFSQFIRIALITIVLFLFYEYVAQLTNIIINQFIIFCNKLFEILVSILSRLTLEWVDVNFILFVQTSAYFSVVFWLLIFLFLIKLKDVFEGSNV